MTRTVKYYIKMMITSLENAKGSDSISKIKINSSVLRSEKEEDKVDVNMSVSYTNMDVEHFDFTELNAVLKRSDGLFIAEGNFSISREVPSNVEIEESVGFYWLDQDKVFKAGESLSAEATIKLGKYRQLADFKSEIDIKKCESTLAFTDAGSGELDIVGGSLQIGEPDEDKFVSVDLVVCVKNLVDKYYPEVNVSYEITDSKDDFLEGSDGIFEVKPLSITYFTRSMYIKKSKLKSAKLHGALKLAEYLETKFFSCNSA